MRKVRILFNLLKKWKNKKSNSPPVPSIEDYGDYRGCRYMIIYRGAWYCAYIEIPIDVDCERICVPYEISYGNPFGGGYASPWPRDATVWIRENAHVRNGYKVVGWDYMHYGATTKVTQIFEDIIKAIDSISPEGGAE